MPAEEKDVVTYNNWKAGPWHSLGPEYGPQEGFNYDCVNMQVYANGSIGPRPCLSEIGMYGDIIHGASYQFFAGSVWYQATDYGMGPLSTGTDDKGRFHIVERASADPKYWDETSGGAATIGTSIDWSTFRELDKPARYSETGFASSSEILISAMPFQRLGHNKIIIGGDGYLLGLDDTGTDGYQAITASADSSLGSNEYPQLWDPAALFQWRDRFWSWGDFGPGSGTYNGNRIHYSAVGDISTWTALGYIDVGGDSELPIIGVWPVFNSLLICMADNRWYRFSFADNPDFGELRYIGTKVIPDHYVTAAVTGNAIVYITRQSGVVVGNEEGVDDGSFAYVKIPNEGDDTVDAYFMRGVTSHAHNAICLPYKVKTVGSTVVNNVYKGDRSLELVNGVWTHHLYFGPGDDSVLNPAIVDVIPMGNDHYGFYALDEYNTHDQTQQNCLYTRPVTLNRPSNSADTFSSNTEVARHTTDTDDRFEGTVWLSTYRPPEKTEAAIEKVIIDFDFWNSTGFTTPAFAVKADCVHQGDEISTISVGSLDASELASTSGTVYKPKRGRVVIRPARMPLSSQIDVSITGIKSVAFKEVSVVYAIERQTPTTNINT